MIEVLKQMVETLEYIYKGANNQGAHTGISWRDVSNKAQPAIQAGRQAIAELESQESVACVNGCSKFFKYAKPQQRTKIVFPTMLRKMWSGGEVQAWLDENVNKENKHD